MPESVIDGTGTGYEAKVGTDNRLSVHAITEPEDKAANIHGKTWSLPFTITPVGAGDYFFYLKNTGDEVYSITDIRILSGAIETIEVHVVSGTATFTAPSTITPVNKNLNSSKVPSITVSADTDTTGLSDEGELYFLRSEAVNDFVQLNETIYLLEDDFLELMVSNSDNTGNVTTDTYLELVREGL